MSIVSAKRGLGLLALLLGAVGACSGKTVTQGGSETNWFAMCAHDSDCSVGSCLCGVCTQSCDDASGCPSGLDACASTDTPAFGDMCNSSAPKRLCLKGCGSGVVCAEGFTCDSGACVPTQRTDADAGSGGGTGSGGTTGSGGKTGSAGTSAGQAGAATAMSGPTTATVFVDQITISQDPGPLTGKCMPRTLPVDSSGQVTCTVVSIPSDQSSCQCDVPGFRPLVADELASARERLRETNGCDGDGKPSCDSLCGCAVVQESGDDLTKCQTSTDVQGITPGWCYIDASVSPGGAGIVDKCPSTQKRALRFVGATQNQVLLLECSVTSVAAAEAFNGMPGNLGDPCIPGDEYNKNFSGYTETEINVESRTSICTTGICLAANFRGRVSCPFGQPAAESPDPVTHQYLADPNTPPEERCYVPGAPHVPENLIAVPVEAQLTARLPDNSVYCSCRCDGPAGTGPFCDCPSGFQCQKLVDAYGTSGGAQLAGSYCIKAGTEVLDPTQLTNTTNCNQLDPSIKNLPPPKGCGTGPASAGNGTDGG